jgi:hypothetical protein
MLHFHLRQEVKMKLYRLVILGVVLALFGCTPKYKIYTTGSEPRTVEAPDLSASNVLVVENMRPDHFLVVNINGTTLPDSIFFTAEDEPLKVVLEGREACATNRYSRRDSGFLLSRRHSVKWTYCWDAEKPFTARILMYNLDGEAVGWSCRTISVSEPRPRAPRWIVENVDHLFSELGDVKASGTAATVTEQSRQERRLERIANWFIDAERITGTDLAGTAECPLFQ